MGDINALVEVMSDDQLNQLKLDNPDNTSIATLVDGILEAREKAKEQVKANEDFANGMRDLVAALPHLDNIHNALIKWGKYEVEEGEAQEVDIPNDDNPRKTHKEMRVPKVEKEGYIIEVNHTCKLSSGGGAKSATSKRAITVFKHNPNGADENKGDYPSASKACEALGLVVGGDSAMRVLAREGYYTTPTTS